MPNNDQNKPKDHAPTTPAVETEKEPDAKRKLKIRELTEEEVGEVSGGRGGLAAFCQGN